MSQITPDDQLKGRNSYTNSRALKLFCNHEEIFISDLNGKQCQLKVFAEKTLLGSAIILSAYRVEHDDSSVLPFKNLLKNLSSSKSKSMVMYCRSDFHMSHQKPSLCVHTSNINPP